jgi:hypothetical protein
MLSRAQRLPLKMPPSTPRRICRPNLLAEGFDHAVAVAIMRIEADAGAVVAADQDVSHGVPSADGQSIVAKTLALSCGCGSR